MAYMTHTAQDKGLRHHFSSALRRVRAFSTELYAAHGGWHPLRGATGVRFNPMSQG